MHDTTGNTARRNDTANYWRSGVPLGDLLTGELTRWQKGVCLIEARRNGTPVEGGYQETPKALVVTGEGGHRLARIPLQGKTGDDVDRELARTLEAEHAAL